MQLASESVRETVKGEQCRIGKEPTNTFVASALDDRGIGVEDSERSISDESNRNRVHLDDRQVLQKGDDEQDVFHFFSPRFAYQQTDH